MPLCACGTVLTDIRGADEQVRWAERLGDCWGYRENGTAYWFKCFRCHVREWPNDFKVKNRYSRPAPSWLHLHWTARPRGQLASGDFFFLTTPPPERRGRQHPRCVDAVPAVVFRGSSHFPCPKSPRWGTPTTQVQLAARPCKLSSMLGRPAFGHHRHSKTLPIPAARVAPEAASTHRWPAHVPTKSEPNLKLNTQSSKGARPRLSQQTLRFCGQKS